MTVTRESWVRRRLKQDGMSVLAVGGQGRVVLRGGAVIEQDGSTWVPEGEPGPAATPSQVAAVEAAWAAWAAYTPPEPTLEGRIQAAARRRKLTAEQLALAAVVVAREDGAAPPRWATAILRKLASDVDDELSPSVPG